MAKKKEKKYFSFNASITVDGKEIAGCDISKIEEKALNKLNVSWFKYRVTVEGEEHSKWCAIAKPKKRFTGAFLKVKIERWQPINKP